MKLIAILIIMVFLSWDFLVNTNKSNPEYLFTVGKVEYSMKDWQDNYRRMISDPLSAQEALHNPLYAKSRLLDELIKKALILQEAERLGFQVSDKMVASEVVNLKMFKDEKGNFSSQLLEETLEKNQINEKDFINNMREKLVQNHLMDIFYNSSGIMAQPLYNLLKNLVTAETEVLLYKIPPTKLELSLSEEELKKYVKENPTLFTLPEKAEYLELKFNSNNLDQKSLDISEEELQKAYEAGKEFEPEKRIFNQIVVADYKEALALKKSLDEGKIQYDTLAKSYKDRALVPYEMGPIAANNLDKDFAQEIFQLQEGGIGKVLGSPIGWHLLRLVKIIPKEAKKFSQVQETLRIKLKEEKISQELQKIAAKIIAKEENSLEDFATEYNMKTSVKNIEWKAGKDEDGFSRQKIIQNIFQGDKKGVKIISAQDNKSFLLLEVVKIIPKSLEAFDYDKVKKVYLEEAQDKASREKATLLREAILAKKTLPFEIKPEKLIFSRIQSALPEIIVKKIVNLNDSGIFTGVIGPEKSDGFYLLAQLGKINFEAKITPEKEEEVRSIVYSLYQETIFKNYLESLKKIYPVKVREQFEEYLKSID